MIQLSRCVDNKLINLHNLIHDNITPSTNYENIYVNIEFKIPI